jgi:acylglycerol lipase
MVFFMFFSFLSDLPSLCSGVVFYAHGIFDTASRYDEFMYRTFVARGFAVHAFDFVGHGRSGGERGQWTDCALNVVDLHRFVCDTLALPRFERLPYFVVAKASGVILANHMIDRIMRDNFVRKPSGFCCISPAGKVKKTYSAAKKAVARFAAKVAPRMDVASIKVEFMNSIPAERTAYETDPLVYHGNFSSATAAALLKSIRDTDYSRIRCPVFVLAAELEQVVDADAGLVLYDTVPAPSKLLKSYDACWHDLVREPQKEQVFNDIGNWMLAILACAGPAPPGERVVVVTDAAVPAGHLSAQVPDSLIHAFALLAPLAAPNVAPWYCNAADCHRVFGVEDDLLHHVRTAHMVSGPYRCFACQKEHSTIDDVHAHEHAKHKPDAGALQSFAHSVVRTMHQTNSDSSTSSGSLPLLDSALQRRGSRLGFVVPPVGTSGQLPPAMRDMSPPVSPTRDDAAASQQQQRRRRRQAFLWCGAAGRTHDDRHVGDEHDAAQADASLAATRRQWQQWRRLCVAAACRVAVAALGGAAANGSDAAGAAARVVAECERVAACQRRAVAGARVVDAEQVGGGGGVGGGARTSGGGASRNARLSRCTQDSSENVAAK